MRPSAIAGPETVHALARENRIHGRQPRPDRVLIVIWQSVPHDLAEAPAECANPRAHPPAETTPASRAARGPRCSHTCRSFRCTPHPAAPHPPAPRPGRRDAPDTPRTSPPRSARYRTHPRRAATARSTPPPSMPSSASPLGPRHKTEIERPNAGRRRMQHLQTRANRSPRPHSHRPAATQPPAPPRHRPAPAPLAPTRTIGRFASRSTRQTHPHCHATKSANPASRRETPHRRSDPHAVPPRQSENQPAIYRLRIRAFSTGDLPPRIAANDQQRIRLIDPHHRRD